MRLAHNPDLSRPAALGLTTIAVTLVVGIALAVQHGHIGTSLGDTDDAMRLVLARRLLSGYRWYDQFFGRVQPPLGLWPHWSRLIDGGLAGLIGLARLVTSPANAEIAVRFVWPLLWVPPAVFFALNMARSLGERAAVMATALIIVLTLRLFIQFLPGRVDHHNLQITLMLGAMAGAMNRGTRPAALAGVASGLGLAIGLEALVFHVLVGASFALRLARRPDDAPAVRAYGVGLVLATCVFFAIQTPPWRWSLSFCDEVGWNLVAAVAVAGLGLALAASLSRRLAPWARIGLAGFAGALAAAIYLALDPSCIHGPFVALDPRVRPFWFDRIQEIQGWRTTLASDRTGVIRQGTAAFLAGLSLLLLFRRKDRGGETSTLLAAGAVIAATAATISARRMEAYLYWLAAPMIGAGVSVVARRWLRDLLILTLAALGLVLPSLAAAVAADAADAVLGTPKKTHPLPPGRCFWTRAYARLARLPPGLVVSETDLGPFILAATPHSVLAAPYHRLSPGILAAHRILAAQPARAEALARAAHATYIVDCPPYPMAVGSGSFGTRLRQGEVPAWLERLSPPGDILQIYHVTPAAPARRDTGT